MRIILLALMTLVPFLYSATTFAQVTSVDQLFFGSRGADISCGVDGRLVKKSEVQEIENFCEQVQSQWAIWKIDGEDGKFWSLMGWGYRCQMKASVSLDAYSVCAMKDTPSENTGYFFFNPDFRGQANWNGKAVISKKNDEISNTSVNSVKLGKDIQVMGYSLPDFRGSSELLTQSTPKTSFTFKSYKVLQKSKPNPDVVNKEVTVSFVSDAQNNPCMMVGFVLGESQIICKNDAGKHFAIGDSSEFMETHQGEVGFMLIDGEKREIGKVAVHFSDAGDINLISEELPTDMSVILDSNNLQFAYYPDKKPEPEVTGQDVTVTFSSTDEGDPCMMVGFVLGESHIICKSSGQVPVIIGNSDDFKPGEEEQIGFMIINGDERTFGSVTVVFDDQGFMTLVSQDLPESVSLVQIGDNLGFSYDPIPNPNPDPEIIPKQNISISFVSSRPDLCLRLLILGVSITDECPEDEPKRLTELKEQGYIPVQLFIYQKETFDVIGKGVVLIVFDGGGDFHIDLDASLFPQGLSVSQTDNELKFKYTSSD